jgi:hypothetical protein
MLLVILSGELIAKPLNLPGTLAPDPHFSATAPLPCDVSRGFAISSKKNNILRKAVNAELLRVK